MTKVLLIGNTAGSLLTFRKELILRLKKDGYNVIIYCPSGPMDHCFLEMGCEFFPVNFSVHGKNLFKEANIIAQLFRLIKKTSPDAVLTYTIKPNIYAGIVCSFLGVAYITSVTGLGIAFQKKNLLRSFLAVAYRIAVKRSRCVFFQNQQSIEVFKDLKILKNTPYKLVPGSGVNLEVNRFREYPSEDGGLIFFTPSRIRKDKGMDEYFFMVHEIYKSYLNCCFVLAGRFEEDNYDEEIKTLSGEGDFHYLGNLNHDDIPMNLSKAHAVILPTYHEGMSNSLLEAASTGRVCIASNIPGCREAIEDGKSGILFQPKDKEACLAAVVKFIELTQDERRKMGILARTKMENEFDRNFVINAYVAEIAKDSRSQ
jgi:galacturonosyltransferase